VQQIKADCKPLPTIALPPPVKYWLQIWSALRNEMVMAPSAFGVVGGEELQTKRALAARCEHLLSNFLLLPASAYEQYA